MQESYSFVEKWESLLSCSMGSGVKERLKRTDNDYDDDNITQNGTKWRGEREKRVFWVVAGWAGW